MIFYDFYIKLMLGTSKHLEGLDVSNKDFICPLYTEQS